MGGRLSVARQEAAAENSCRQMEKDLYSYSKVFGTQTYGASIEGKSQRLDMNKRAHRKHAIF